MADPALSTRAPENDIMEDESLDTPLTTAPPPNPLQTTPILTTTNQIPTPQPTLSEHCTTDRPLPTNSTPTGELTTLSTSVKTYISKPADYPSTPARLLLLLTNGRGVLSPNNQLQADSYASQGYVVVMPDLFGGDAAPETTTSAVEEHSWLDSIKARVVETSKSFMIDMWLARHTSESVVPILEGVLGAVREEFADAVAHGGGIYAVGYCFGGKYVLALAGGGLGNGGVDVEANTGVEIKCGAVAHATLVTREDFKGVKVPLSLVCVENDPLFPEEVLDFGKKELGASSVKHEVKVYSGVPHGFAVVGEYDSVTIKEAQSAAASQMLDWLQRH